MVKTLMPQDFATFRQWGKLSCNHGTCAIVGYCIQQSPKREIESEEDTASTRSEQSGETEETVSTSPAHSKSGDEESIKFDPHIACERQPCPTTQAYFLRLKDFKNVQQGGVPTPKMTDSTVDFVLENILNVRNRLENRRSASCPMMRKKSWTVDPEMHYLLNLRTV
uniref:Uncharacterized protein n=1 Tax=Hanusia phi TaxID=3032 RepID=A0A7S0HEK6_9CRYP